MNVQTKISKAFIYNKIAENKQMNKKASNFVANF